MSETDEIVADFVAESRENLDRMETNLIALERDGSRQDLVADLFRTMHTVKGTSAFLGFAKLEALAHAGEELLSRVREGEVRVDPRIANALLEVADAVRRGLAAVEAGATDGAADHAALIARLAAACVPAEPVEPALAGADEEARPAERVLASEAGSVRVDVRLLDRLVNLVGELVLARNQSQQTDTTRTDPASAAAWQRLHVITRDLQSTVMKTRMLPLETVVAKLPRIVRDLAVACGKEVELEIEGQDTELDRSLIEALRDPLMHLVRNAIDHGLETPEARITAGKRRAGSLAVHASYGGGHVHITLADDGRGIDLERLKAKAVERGALTPGEAAAIDDRDAASLVFLPGLSTSARVTNLSGRGVGMDVVKTNLEEVGGSVDLQTSRGAGTTVHIKLPLTLAIVPALTVLAHGQRFVVPQASVLELLRLDQSDASTSRIETIHGAPVYRLRGGLIPIAYLDRELALAPRDLPEVSNIVVVQAGEQRFGLVVDAIEDAGEIVVKPLPSSVKDIPIFAGATILRNGAVALILDVPSLARRAHVLAPTLRDQPAAPDVRSAPESDAATEPLLLVRANDGGRMAVPLPMVARLAEFRADTIERAGDDEVVQHAGSILLLIRLSRVLVERRRRPRASKPPEDSDKVQVVIVDIPQRGKVGLVVDTIDDIAQDRLEVTRPPSRPGVRCSAVIRAHVTELLDVPALVHTRDAGQTTSFPPPG
jgi:two-component system chemotaxis sensor kinase CheA